VKLLNSRKVGLGSAGVRFRAGAGGKHLKKRELERGGDIHNR
jgi:hypothetical protein